MKEIIACLLCLMFLPLHATAQEKTTLKEKVIAIPVGEFVEIRTIDKSKIRGRIGAATNDAVAVETIAAGKPETVQVEFARMKSIRVTSPVEPSTVVVALAVLGGVLLIAGAIVASR